jgi:NADP-dependent 3-hydroxy acid dehydrogenase YdfG
MPKHIIVVGFGPGISTAVAERFGGAGFSVTLVARNAERLAGGVEALQARGITAAAFAADAGDPDAVRGAVAKARVALGPITAIHWNAFSNETGDLTVAGTLAVQSVFDVAITGLVTAVQEALSDLKAAGDGAVLVTNGAFGETTPQMDALGVSFKVMGLALANAAKHKLVGLLSARLKDDGVFVGEVMVAGAIKGTAWDNGATIEAATVADRFWRLYEARDEVRARVS